MKKKLKGFLLALLSVTCIGVVSAGFVGCGPDDNLSGGGNSGGSISESSSTFLDSSEENVSAEVRDDSFEDNDESSSEKDASFEGVECEHEWKCKLIKSATCTEKGLNTYECVFCGNEYSETVSALGHGYVSHSGKAATCTSSGYKAYQTCSRCDYTTYEEIGKVGHNYQNGVCIWCEELDPDNCCYISTDSYTDDYGVAGTFTEYDSERFVVGTTVTLTATVKDGYNFEGWFVDGTCMSSGLVYEFEAKKDIWVIAVYSYYTLSTWGDGDEEGMAGTYTKFEDEKVSAGKEVILTATIKKGYNFDGWYIEDICVSENLRYTFTMEKESKEIYAKFSCYTVSSWASDDDGGLAGNCTKWENKKISAGEEVTLTATVKSGYNFDGWYDDWTDVCVCEDLEYTFTMEKENKEVYARYSYFVICTESWSDEQGVAGTYTKMEGKKVSAGTEVTLTATVNDGYNFEGWYDYWEGVCFSKELTYTFVMGKEDRDFKAKYSYYVVNAWAEDDDYGMAGTYTKFEDEKVSAGTQVTLTATVNDGYNFEGWYDYWGDVCFSKNLTYTFVMGKEDKDFKAKYSYYVVNTWADGHDYGMAGTYTQMEDEKVSEGTQVTLTATVNSGYRFLGWYRDDVCMTKNLKYTFTMKKEDIGIRAVFEISECEHNLINYNGHEATCTTSGCNAYQTCSYCGYTTYEEISALGHDYINHVGKAATCTTVGHNAYTTCSRCDYTTYQVIPMVDHNYKRGVCIDCRYEKEANLNLEFTKKDNYYAVTGIGSCTDSVIVIPQTYQNLPVKQIGNDAFYMDEWISGKDSVTEIIIPDGVTYIGQYAFFGRNGLTSIILPDSVEYIGDYAFCGCSSATEIVLPNSLSNINTGAFGDCSSLTEIVIPDSVTSIYNYAFAGCTSLDDILLPNSIISIGAGAFKNCSSLSIMIIPAHVTEMGSKVFLGCDGLTMLWCDAANQPNGWASDWNSSNCPETWLGLA